MIGLAFPVEVFLLYIMVFLISNSTKGRIHHNQNLILLPETTQEQWLEQAQMIQSTINEKTIEQALLEFPLEIQKDATSDWIKKVLMARKKDKPFS